MRALEAVMCVGEGSATLLRDGLDGMSTKGEGEVGVALINVYMLSPQPSPSSTTTTTQDRAHFPSSLTTTLACLHTSTHPHPPTPTPYRIERIAAKEGHLPGRAYLRHWRHEAMSLRLLDALLQEGKYYDDTTHVLYLAAGRKVCNATTCVCACVSLR